jgi:hypothetical protein
MGTRRSREEQIKIYEAWKASGLTQMEYSRQNGINIKSLSNWIRKFRICSGKENGKQDQEAIKFLPVGNIVLPDKNFLEFNLPNGINCKAYLAEEKIDEFFGRLLRCK